MFTGDTLFRGSCGRVDLAGGDASTILASLKRMAVIPGDYEIYPGHMETSTLAIERVYNPYVVAALSGVTEF
jgi:glyoxylase-like metal-dependent hydrolase (beta-lactamase superfamily II)